MKPTKEDYLQRAKDYALQHGGECLATQYISAKTKTIWKCKNPEHPVFENQIQIVGRGSWCTLCSIEKNAQKYTLINGLEKAQAHALSKGGVCLSTEYKNAKTKLDCHV